MNELFEPPPSKGAENHRLGASDLALSVESTRKPLCVPCSWAMCLFAEFRAKATVVQKTTIAEYLRNLLSFEI